MTYETRLIAMGIKLPHAAPAAANYVPYVKEGNLLIIAGQLPIESGEKKFVGRLGENLSIEEGQAAARLCAINILAQISAAENGKLHHVKRILRLGVFVNSAPDFTDQPLVANGASDLFVDVFGDVGRHARAAVGVNTLPFGVSVEVDALVALRD